MPYHNCQLPYLPPASIISRNTASSPYTTTPSCVAPCGSSTYNHPSPPDVGWPHICKSGPPLGLRGDRLPSCAGRPPVELRVPRREAREPRLEGSVRPLEGPRVGGGGGLGMESACARPAGHWADLALFVSRLCDRAGDEWRLEFIPSGVQRDCRSVIDEEQTRE